MIEYLPNTISLIETISGYCLNHPYLTMFIIVIWMVKH